MQESSAAGENGLANRPSTQGPIFAQNTSLAAVADIMQTGTPGRCFRIQRSKSEPFIPGISKSVRIKSNLRVMRKLIASLPSHAQLTLNRIAAAHPEMILRMCALSSTTRSANTADVFIGFYGVGRIRSLRVRKMTAVLDFGYSVFGVCDVTVYHLIPRGALAFTAPRFPDLQVIEEVRRILKLHAASSPGCRASIAPRKD
jgi:hypothetical protein